MTFNHLEEKAKEAKGGKSPEERIDALLAAFELFCQETSRLEQAYSSLQEEFKSVNLALDNTNKELESKVFELNRITHYLENILSHISQGLMFVGFNGIITTFNDAFETMLGINKSEVIGKKYDTLFKDEMFGFSVKQALITKTAPPFSRIRLGKENERFYEVEASFLLKNNKSNEGEGLIILMRDVTRLKVLELVANRNDRMKELGEMAAQVAHEIRNPLGGIKGFASLLKRDLQNNPEQAKMADYIIEGTDNLNRLVTQVLNYSRPSTPSLQPVDMADIVKEVQNFIKVDSNIQPQPRFVTHIAEGTNIVHMDYGLMRGALLNLLVNSCQAMPNGGTIEIEVKTDSTKCEIRINDTGIGIPSENFEKVFSPFFTTKANGNGFGLAEVHKVVQAHGGNINLQSEIDRGTTFIITLPIQGH